MNDRAMNRVHVYPLATAMRGIFSILFRLPQYIRLAWRLMKDPRVPWYSKLLVYVIILYGISPVDLLPEALFPHLGYGEDILLFLLALQQLIRTSPPDVVTGHASDIAEEKRRRKEDVQAR